METHPVCEFVRDMYGNMYGEKKNNIRITLFDKIHLNVIKGVLK